MADLNRLSKRDGWHILFIYLYLIKYTLLLK